MEERRLFGLDLMRCIAILMVVYVHSVNMLTVLVPVKIIGFIIGKTVAITFLFGAYGVEMFFALSGFLIGGILIKTFVQFPSFKNLAVFWLKRWFRTLPLYFFVLTVNFLAFSYFNPKYLIFIQNITSPIEGGFFLESWSLAIEEWSYLLFPILYIITHTFVKDFKKSLKYTLLLGIIGSWIIRIIYLFLGFEDLRTIVITRIDAIFYGILVAYLVHEKHKFILKNVKKIFYYLLAILLLTYIILRMGAAPFNLSAKFSLFKYGAELISLPLINICFAFLIPYLLNIGDNLHIWLKKTVTFISKISYSMYLWHYSFLYIFLFGFKKANSLMPAEVIPMFILYWLVTICISYISYRIIEKPFIKLRNGIFIKS